MQAIKIEAPWIQPTKPNKLQTIAPETKTIPGMAGVIAPVGREVELRAIRGKNEGLSDTLYLPVVYGFAASLGCYFMLTCSYL